MVRHFLQVRLDNSVKEIAQLLLHADEAMVSFPPENVTIELGQNGTFSCNSTSPYIEWSLTESNNSKCQTIDVERTDKSLQSKQRLADRGIFITYYEVEDGLYSSEIIINGNLNNNFTRLDCNYAMAIGSKKCEDPGPAFLKVFGKERDT